MSLTEKISAAFRRKAQSAKEAYVAALRGGNDGKILAAAESAGITPTQIQADAAIIDKAAELAETLSELPAAEAALAAAQRKSADAEAKLQSVLKPLQEAAKAAGVELYYADEKVRAIRPQLFQAAGLWREHAELLPAESAPPVLREHWKSEREQESIELKKRHAMGTLLAAKRKVDALESATNELELRGTFGVPKGVFSGMVDPDEMRQNLPAAIEQARKELAAAKTALDEAKSDAGRLGIDTTKGL